MRLFRPRFAAPVVLALSILGTVPARAQPAPGATLADESELARAVTLYELGKFPECVTEFKTLLGDGGPRKLEQPDVVERARVYYAACLIATTGETPDNLNLAREQFKQAILKNPTMRAPDSLVFPQRVIDVFYEVQAPLMEEIKRVQREQLAKAEAAARRAAERAAAERARVRRLEEYARQELSVTKNRRWVAMVPFGVGQFQNGDTALGWIFLGTEAALAATALTSLIVIFDLNSQVDDESIDTAQLNQRLDAWYQVLVLSSWGFIGVAVGGIVQAQIAFQPQFRELKKRPLPKDVRPPPEEKPPEAWLRPSPVAVPGGVGVGVVGRF